MIGRLAWPSILPVKEPVGWSLAAAGCLILFFCLTFPYGNLQARVLFEVSRATGWDVRATDWSSAFPLGFEWREVVLVRPDAGSLSLETVRTSIGIVQALMGKVAMDYVLQLPGATQTGTGRAQGSLTAGSWSFQGPIAVKGHLHQIDLALVLKPYVSRGVAQGDFTQRWESSLGPVPTFKGDGVWKAEIKDLVVERIPAGQGVIPSLAFGRITANVNCHDAICDITELKGDGPDGAFSAQGRVTMQQPMQQSQLDVTVTLLPGAGFSQKATGLGLPPFQPGTQFTVKLAGPISQPRVIL